MNCKFCNNFIPDDAKVCSICGKNVEEEAIVAVEAPAAEAPAVVEAEKKAEKVYKKKSLKLPSLIILLAVVAFIALYTIGDGAAGCAQFRGWVADQTNPGSTAVSETDNEDPSDITIDVGDMTDDTEKTNADEGKINSILPAVIGNGVPGLVGLAGVALLGKRVSGNRKAKKQETAAK